MSTTTKTERGSNFTPKRQKYSVRSSRKLKDATEQYATYSGLARRSPEIRSALAYFTIPLTNHR